MILTKQNIERIDIDQLINEKIITNSINELLLIVPTNRKARSLKKEIISRMPNHSAAEISIETLGTISSKLLKESMPYKQLSEAASIIFIKQSVSEIKLRYFSVYKYEIPFGTLDRIKNVISEYKRQGITPNHLREEANKLDRSEKLKALDIADIYEKYLTKCNSINAFEIGDIYNHLNNLTNEQFVNNFLTLYKNVNLIVITGFDQFSIPEIKILNRLADIKVNLFINFDYNQNNKLIFSHLDICYTRLENVGFRKIEDVSETRLNQFRSTVKNHLFKINPKEQKYNYTEKIFKIIAHDRQHEIELISREIKKLITEENVELHKICVVFNLIQNYSSLVRDIFTKNGLTFNLTDRIPLNASNPVKAIINFLEIAENDYYFQNIFRALSSDYLTTDNIDFFNLFKVSSELKIVSGKENWFSIITESINNLKLNSDEDTEEKNKKLNAYQKALSDIKFIAELLSPFESKMTIRQFKENLFSFINTSKLPIRLLSVTHNQEENIRGFSKFIETITELFDLLEKERGMDAVFNLHFFMEQLRTACSWARFNVKEKSNYGIQVTTLEEIRGLNFDYLFIGGLCDGDLPTRYNPEIFFSGSYKKHAAVHQTEERNLFYQALCCWNKKLFLSFPQTEGERELVTSSFIKDLEEWFLISERKEDDYANTIFSMEELEIYLGKNNFRNLDYIPDDLKIDVLQLQKSIEVEKLRQSNILSESPYNGILFTDNSISSSEQKLKEILNSFTERQYSVSQLETYAKCPFKFFIEKIIGIEIIEEPTEEIEAIEMGRILHSILFEFYTEIRDENINLKICNEDELKELKKRLFDIADRKISQSFFKSPLTFYEKEKLMGIGGNSEESILGKFIEYELTSDDNYTPNYFEVSFGSLKEERIDKILSDPEPIKINGLKLRGKIDRIEISDEDNSINVVDYKLGGTKPSFRDLKNGISLQLPIYLYAATELLKRKFGITYKPNEMFIYSLKYSEKEFGKLKVSLKRDEEIKTIDQLIDCSLRHIKNYIKFISEGKFNLSPHDDREKIVCRYCQFKSICRIKEAIGEVTISN